MGYVTVKERAQVEIVIQKSRFIAHIFPVPDEQSAKAHIDETSKKYWDATHNCYAYAIGENRRIQKSSDDGEPSGTAGVPILETIKKSGLTDTLIIVTRYFGGIKLGAGGLIRAYAQSASAAIREAPLIEKVEHRLFELTVDYAVWAKIESRLERTVRVHDKQFTDCVTVRLSVPEAEGDKLPPLIQEWTNGIGRLVKRETARIDIPYEITSTDRKSARTDD